MGSLLPASSFSGAAELDTNALHSLLPIPQANQAVDARAADSLLGANAWSSYLQLMTANRASNLGQSFLTSHQGPPVSQATLLQQLSANPALASFPRRGATSTAGSFPFNSAASVPPNLMLSLLAQVQAAESNRNMLQQTSLFSPSFGALTGANNSTAFHPAAAADGPQHSPSLGVMELLASAGGPTGPGGYHSAAASLVPSSTLHPSEGAGSSSATNPSHSSLSNTVQEDAAIASITQEAEAGPIVASDGDSRLLYAPADDTKLSPYQCLARQQLEFFVVKTDDLEAGAQGRNRPIVLGQVGVRCRHCAQVPHRQKQRASAYFPAKLSGVYQTAQNITNTHLCQLCHRIPPGTRRNLQLLQSKKSGSGGGRKYWSESADAAGIREVEGGGLCFQDQQEAERPEEKPSG